MTIIRPNSIAGITSLTAYGDNIEFYKSDGIKAGLNLDGVNINSIGISTFSGGIELGTGTTIGSPASNTFTVSTNGSERIRVGAGGSVGIGTDDPTTKLHVQSGVVSALPRGGSYTQVLLESSDADYNFLELQSPSTARSEIVFSKGNSGQYGIVGYNNADDSLRLVSNGSERVNIDANGTIRLKGVSSDWGTTTQGTTPGTLHLDPENDTNNYGSAITFGASDSGAGETAHAGIYIRSDSSYGTKMYLSTTDSYATGSKTSIEIDHSGYITAPRQPSFRVYSPSSVANNVITFGSTEYNIGNHMNASTGVFTAPIAGRYLFTFSILCGSPMGSYVRIGFCKNSTSPDFTFGDTLWDGLTSYGSPGMAMIFDLAANDNIRLYTADTKVYGTSYGSFSGCLLS